MYICKCIFINFYMGKTVYTHQTTWAYANNIKIRSTQQKVDHDSLARAQMHFNYLKHDSGVISVKLIELATGPEIQTYSK